MTTIATAPGQRCGAAPVLPVGSAARRVRRQLTCRVVGTLAAAALFVFVAGQLLTARPARVFAELLADSIAAGYGTADHERTQPHAAAVAWAGAAHLRLARMRRVATPLTRTRPAAPAGRRRRWMLEESPRDGGTSTAAMRRQPGRWLHRIGIGVTLLAGLMLVPTAAHAEPTPAPPSPSAPAQPPAAACGGGDLPADQQRWCFGWAVYTANPPRNSVSHWTTACTRTKTPDELAACQTVSLEFTSKPKDGARATLADVPVGTAPVKDMVGCKQFTVAAREAAGKGGQQGFAESQIWLGMASRCDAIAAALLPALGASVAPPPPKADKQCDTFDQQCKIDKAVGGAVERGIDAGIQGVINLSVQGVAVVLSWLASQVFTQTSIGAPDDAFYLVYNSTAGIMLIFVFVLFIISAIINTLRFSGGPSPLASVGGLVRAVIGITFAGGIAWLIVTAWDQATNALLAQNDSTAWDASIWITALTNLSGGAGTGAIALIAGLFSLIGLLFLFVIMLFRGMLTTAAALFGAVAMAGQASHETRSWGRRWFWTVNALAMSKFAIAALWIYGTRAAYGSNDITTVLQAVLIIWLMVLAPGILLRLTAIWDGYLADANGRGFATAAAAGIGDLAGRAADSLMDRVGGKGGSGGGDAAEVMDDNVTDMDNAGSSTGTDDTGDSAVEGVADTAGELTEDAETNESGEQVGAPDSNGGPAAAGDDGGGSPNGDEADAIDDNATGAQTDIAAATHDLSAAGQGDDQGDNGSAAQVPTGPTGESGTEQPGADGTGSGAADPAATSSGAGSAEPDGTSSDPAGAGGSTSLPGLGDGSGSAGADAADPSGGSPPTQPAAPAAGTDGGGSDGASDAGAEPPAGGAPAAGEGAAGAGGAAGGSSAAAAAAF